MADIFISYSRRDLHVVEKLRADLGAAGFGVWQDKEQIRGGHRWRLQIEQGIEEAGVFLLVASANSFRTDYVWDEVEAALHDTKPIMVLTVGEAPKPNGLKWLNKYHTIFHQPNGQHIGELTEALAQFDIFPRSGTGGAAVIESYPSPDQRTTDERELEDTSERLLGEHPELAAIEEKRAALEQERQQLKEQSKQLKLDSAQKMLERERALLESQNEKLQLFEKERKEELQREQERLAAERAELESEQAELEQKRIEQRQLAGETVALQADQSARLELLNSEIHDADAQLVAAQEKLALQEHKNEVAREQEAGRYRTLIETTQREEQQLAVERRELEKRIAQLKRTQRRPLALILAGIVITCGVAGVTAYYTKPAFLSYFWKKGSQEELWEKFAEQRAAFSKAQDWAGLLGTAVLVEDRFNDPAHFTDPGAREVDESKQERFRTYFDRKRSEIDSDVRDSVMGLLAEMEAGESPDEDEEERVLKSLDVVIGWEVAPQAPLLRALLHMPRLADAGNYAIALEEYLQAVRSDASAAGVLEGQLGRTVAAMVRDFGKTWALDRQSEVAELLSELPQTGFAVDSDPRLLRESILAEQLRLDGKPVDAMEAVMTAAAANPDWAPELEPVFKRCLADVCKLGQPEISWAFETVATHAAAHPTRAGAMEAAASAICEKITARPPGDVAGVLELFLSAAGKLESWKPMLKRHVSAVLPHYERALEMSSQDDISLARPVLVRVAMVWSLAEPYAILAAASEDEQEALGFHKQAAALGNLDSKAIAGGQFASFGKDEAERQRGLAWVKEAVENENATGFLELGKLYLYGSALNPDLSQAIDFLTRAERELASANKKLHPESRYHLGYALRQQGIEEESKDLLMAAANHLDAASLTQPEAYVPLYTCYRHPLIGDPAKARETLEKGAGHKDPQSLYLLGILLYSGHAPFEEDGATGRGHILDAAKAGDPRAREWCLENFPIIRESGTAADKSWIEKHWGELDGLSR